MNLRTRNTTYETGGRPAGAHNALNEMCKSFEGMWPAGIIRDTAGGTNYCRQIR